MESYSLIPDWLIVVAYVAMLAAMTSIGWALLAAVVQAKTGFPQRLRLTRPLYTLVVGGVIFWFCFDQLFRRFHEVIITNDHASIVYAWPKGSIAFSRDRLLSAEIKRFRKGKSEIVALLTDGLARSVTIDANVDGESVAKRLMDWKAEQRQP